MESVATTVTKTETQHKKEKQNTWFPSTENVGIHLAGKVQMVPVPVWNKKIQTTNGAEGNQEQAEPTKPVIYFI